MSAGLRWIPNNCRPKTNVDLLDGGKPEAEVDDLLCNDYQEVEVKHFSR